MSRRILRIAEQAEAEARSAFSWYAARNALAAANFQTALEECIASIADAPTSFAEVEPDVRRCLLAHRFPYAVLFRVTTDDVQVIALMHLHRRPGYWRR